MTQEPEPPTNLNHLAIDEPDYASYSLDQLRDVHRRIDRERFPERFARLEEELKGRRPEAEVVEEVEYGSEMSRNLGVPFDVLTVYRFMLTTVQWGALALALNNGIGQLMGVRWVLLKLSLRLNFGSGWSTEASQTMGLVIYWTLLGFLAFGGLTLLTKSRWMHWFLPLGWGLLSFRIRWGDFLWWPSFYDPIDISLILRHSSNGQLTHLIQLVGVPLALAVIALVTMPDRHLENTAPAQTENPPTT